VTCGGLTEAERNKDPFRLPESDKETVLRVHGGRSAIKDLFVLQKSPDRNNLPCAINKFRLRTVRVKAAPFKMKTGDNHHSLDDF
jgi:hypothetical protein